MSKIRDMSKIHQEVRDLRAHIIQTYPNRHTCPYGLCFDAKGFTVSVRFGVEFRTLPIPEYTFCDVFEYPGKSVYSNETNEECDDCSDNDLEPYEEYGDLYDIYAYMIKDVYNHRHLELIGASPIGKLPVSVCVMGYPFHANYANAGDRVHSIEEFNTMLNNDNLYLVSGMRYVNYLNDCEQQWVTNKLYSHFEGPGPYDIQDKNARMRAIRYPMIKEDSSSKALDRLCKDRMNDRLYNLIEPRFTLSFNSFDWDQHHVNDAKTRRVINSVDEMI